LPYIGNNHPNWRTHIFQRVQTTKQWSFMHIHISHITSLQNFGTSEAGEEIIRRGASKIYALVFGVRLGSIFCGSWNHKNQDTLWRFLGPFYPSSDSMDCWRVTSFKTPDEDGEKIVS
jgi:hypothetical protein